jgi:hypothetical protein
MLHKTYVTELGRSLEYLPTWLPTTRLQLGYIIDRESLQYCGRLDDHKIAFAIRRAPARGFFEYSSASGVSITTKLAGQITADTTLGEAEAGLIVKFERENAIIFEASGCRSTMIADIHQLGDAIKALYRARQWNRNMMVVTEVVQAAAVTILISSGAGGRIDFKAKGAINPGGVRLSRLSSAFEEKHSSNVGFKVIGNSGLTPLYRASGIKRRIFRAPGFATGFRAVEVNDEYDFADLTQEDVVATEI